MANAARYYGTGRRKSSIARVYLVPGTGNVTINKRSIDEYFGLETLKVIVRQPLTATDTVDKFDVLVNVKRRRLHRSGGRNPPRHRESASGSGCGFQTRSEESGLSDPRSSHEGEKEIRPQGCPSRSAVQQALNFIKSGQKPRNYAVSRGFFLFKWF